MEDQQDQHDKVWRVDENELKRSKELDDLALPLVTQSQVELSTTTASRQSPPTKQSFLDSNGAVSGTGQADEFVGRHQGNKNSVSALVQRFNQMAEGKEKGVESSKI